MNTSAFIYNDDAKISHVRHDATTHILNWLTGR